MLKYNASDRCRPVSGLMLYCVNPDVPLTGPVTTLPMHDMCCSRTWPVRWGNNQSRTERQEKRKLQERPVGKVKIRFDTCQCVKWGVFMTEGCPTQVAAKASMQSPARRPNTDGDGGGTWLWDGWCGEGICMKCIWKTTAAAKWEAENK